MPEVSHDFISASMLAVKAKLFDDGLLAAAELAAQHRKGELLASLVNVIPRMAAAARLGGLACAAFCCCAENHGRISQ